MEIRLANLVDLNACLAIDDSFETEYVWQMEEHSVTGDIAIGFHLVRLPVTTKSLRELFPVFDLKTIVDEKLRLAGAKTVLRIQQVIHNLSAFDNDLVCIGQFHSGGVVFFNASRSQRAYFSINWS